MRVIASLRSVISALFRHSMVENEVEEELRAIGVRHLWSFLAIVPE